MSWLKYFRPINGNYSNDETLPSPAGTLSTLMPSTAIFAASAENVCPSITWKLSPG